jgi:glycosyltransferase involved in cell wall biosynthesis
VKADLQQAKRILMTTDAVGGVWQYSIDLIRQLRADGLDALVVCLGPPPSAEQQRKIQAITGGSFVHAPFALEWMQEPWDAIEQARTWLTKLESEFKPDVVHLNSYALAAAPWHAPVLCVAHSCVYSWWRAVHGCAPEITWENYREQVSRGLQAATFIVSPSQAMLDALVHEYGIAQEKATVIPNFSLASPHGPVTKEHFSLAAGRMWDKAKNLSLLEAIAPHLHWPLYLAGSGESRSLQHLGSLSHDEVLERMAAASLFVHPALYEPFGLVVLEAAAAGCCLVLADIPSLRELWDDAAVFINPRDPHAWTRTLNELIANEAQRRELAYRASQAARRYCADTSWRMYRNLYDRLVSRKCRENGVAA